MAIASCRPPRSRFATPHALAPRARGAPRARRSAAPPSARLWGESHFDRGKSSFVHGPEAHPELQRGRRFAVMTHSDMLGTLLTRVAVTPEDPRVLGSDGIFRYVHPDAVFYLWLCRTDAAADGLLVRVCLTDTARRLPDAARRYIFNRELHVVLDCFLHAEERLLGPRTPAQTRSALWGVPVWLHFQSTARPELDEIICLGPLATADAVARLIAAANAVPTLRWQGWWPRLHAPHWQLAPSPEQAETLQRLADIDQSPASPVGWQPDALRWVGRDSLCEAPAGLPRSPPAAGDARGRWQAPPAPREPAPEAPRTLGQSALLFWRYGWQPGPPER